MVKLYLVFMIILKLASSTPPILYELIYMTDSTTTETTGSVTLVCRDRFAEPVAVTRVKFWLNRTSACDLDLRERTDVQAIEVNTDSIQFNLTGDLEGTFTCGILILQDNRITVEESNSLTLICKSHTCIVFCINYH